MQHSIPIPATADCPLRATKAATYASHMDESVFHALYRETAPKLRGYLRRASGDAALADDILQETFYRFLRAELPAMETFQRKAYLYRIAGSLLVDHRRRLQREQRWSLMNFFREEATETKGHGGDAMNTFRTLKPQEQSLLWLAYVEGFDHREIALALELRESSVRVLLFRARKRLAGLLRKRGLAPGEKP